MTPQKVERFYDTVAPLYGFWAKLTENRATRRALEVAAIQAGESVLEVGIGTGTLFCRLAESAQGGRCVGVDLSAGMLRHAQRRLRDEACQRLLCRGDACHLPFPAGAFDAIVSCYVLDIFSEAGIERALAEFFRAVKPGGRLVLVVMAQQTRLLNGIWMVTFRHLPVLVGGCRPVGLAPALMATGWKIDLEEEISQNGFRSQLILARPLGLEARAA